MASVKVAAASRPRLRTPAEAVGLLREVGILTLTPAKGVRSVVEEVVGEPVRGSWWGHPQGHAIYDVASGLGAHPDVLTLKLVEGKVTFVHRTLFPPLLRVATDPELRAHRSKGLHRSSRTVLSRVERCGRLDLEDADLDASGRRLVKKQLEGSMLVLAHQEHTERGHHATFLRSWEGWAEPRVSQAASRLTFDAAVGALAKAAPSLRATLAGPARP